MTYGPDTRPIFFLDLRECSAKLAQAPTASAHTEEKSPQTAGPPSRSTTRRRPNEPQKHRSPGPRRSVDRSPVNHCSPNPTHERAANRGEPPNSFNQPDPTSLYPHFFHSRNQPDPLRHGHIGPRRGHARRGWGHRDCVEFANGGGTPLPPRGSRPRRPKSHNVQYGKSVVV